MNFSRSLRSPLRLCAQRLFLAATSFAVLTCAAAPGPPVASPVGTTLDALPLLFENWSSSHFVARTRQYTAEFDAGRVQIRAGLPGPQSKIIDLKWEGTRTDLEVEGRNGLPTRVNYLIGPEHDWKRSLATFKRVHYRHLYPGTDLDFYGSQGKLEYDFVLQPGADVGAIRLALHGHDRLRINTAGDLVIEAGGEQFVQHRPVCYQSVAGVRIPVRGNYELDNDTIRFHIGLYDRKLPLTIDPTLVYIAPAGAGDSIYTSAIATDPAGNAYIAGKVVGPFLTSANAYQTTTQGLPAFVLKLNPAGTELVYATYYGSFVGSVSGIVADAAGEAVIAVNPDNLFPGETATVIKFNAAGTALIFSTAIQGSTGVSLGSELAIDAAGNIYSAGEAYSATFPTTPGALRGSAIQNGDGFVVKLSPAGNVLYSALLGGSLEDKITAIAVDASGAAYVAGFTISNDFPTTAGAYSRTLPANTTAQTQAMFVTKIAPAGDSIVFSTYFGSPTFAQFGATIKSVGVDGTGNVYIAGNGVVPLTARAAPSLRPVPFVAKFDGHGALLYSTYIGNICQCSWNDSIDSMALAPDNSVVLTGSTRNSEFPITPDAVQSTGLLSATLGFSPFVAELNPSGAMIYSTLLGDAPRNDSDVSPATRVAVDANGNFYVSISDVPLNLTATSGAYGAGNPSNTYIVKFAAGNTCPASLLASGIAGPTASSIPVTLTIPAGCPWITENSQSWVGLNPASGLGPATLIATVAANSGPPRAAAVSIAGQTFNIAQRTAAPSQCLLPARVSRPRVGRGLSWFTPARDVLFRWARMQAGLASPVPGKVQIRRSPYPCNPQLQPAPPSSPSRDSHLPYPRAVQPAATQSVRWILRSVPMRRRPSSP